MKGDFLFSMLFKRKLGDHNGIERFTTTFSAMSVSLVLILSAGLYNQFTKDSAVLAEKAIYNKEVSTSKTNTKLSVENVFVNKEKTKSFVLLKFSDILKVSTQATDYQLFMTEAKVSGNSYTRYSKPGASIYVFGQTGYMGIYLTQESGFKPQVYDMIIRANAELVTKADVTRTEDNKKRDASFSKYDQAQFFFNPGATSATVTDALDPDKLDVEELYKKLVVGPEEAKIKEELTKSLKQLSTDLATINEYDRRLMSLSIDGKHVTESKRPKDIEGDKVVEEDGKLRFETKYVYPTGFNFDWQKKSVVDGFIDDLKPKGKSTVEWLGEVRSQKEKKEDSSFLNMDWFLSDGTSIKSLALKNNDISVVKDATTTITQLTQNWQKYQQDKRKYQTQDLSKLIDLEVTLQNVKANYTLNTDDNVLKMYR